MCELVLAGDVLPSCLDFYFPSTNRCAHRCVINAVRFTEHSNKVFERDDVITKGDPKPKSSYVHALNTHRPSLLPIE